MRRPVLVLTALLLAGVTGTALWWGGRTGDAGDDPAGILVPALPTGPALVETALPSGPGTVLPMVHPDAVALSESGQKALRDLVAATGTKALLIWHAGALQVELYAADVQPGDMLDGRGLMPGLMVMLTGIAQRDGILTGIDTSIGEWLPEWAGDDRGRVTVRHLLEGTSGLRTPATEPGADAAAWTLSATLEAEPGSRLAPNLYEAQVLGLVLSRAAKRPLPELLSQSLWRPMGGRSGMMMAGSADGVPYLGLGVKAIARDWLRPGLLLLEHGQAGDGVGGVDASMVPPPWLDEMQRPLLHSRHDGWRVRLGWPHDPKGGVTARTPFSEGDTIFLAGEDGSRLYVSQARELVILRLGTPVPAWDESALPNLVVRSLTTPPAELRSDNSLKVRRAKDLNGQIEMPPIVKPPPVPKVTVEPLAPLPPDSDRIDAAPAR